MMDKLCSLVVSYKRKNPTEEQKKKIREIFQFLFSINDEGITLLLQMAESKKLKIKLDFEYETIKRMAKGGENCFGYYLINKNVILIGAKRGVKETAGTLIHEIAHFAMHLVYKNKCKPYTMENDWHRHYCLNLLDEINPGKNDDMCNGIIRKIFVCYDTYEDRISEAAARIPQILVMFKEAKSKIAFLKDIYENLFNFYSVYILPDLKDYART